jgi:Rad3-related DNA helicase
VSDDVAVVQAIGRVPRAVADKVVVWINDLRFMEYIG